MKHALVFGGSGQIGRPLLGRLLRDGLTRLIAEFDREATPYRALRRARFNYDYDAYAHLARVAEWSVDTGEED